MSKKNTITLIIVLFVIILLASLAYAYYAYYEPERSNKNTNTAATNTNKSANLNTNTGVNENLNENLNTNAVVNTNASSNTNSLFETNTASNTNTSLSLTGSEVTSVDDTWNRYTNYDFGFYLKIPKQAWFYTGSCYYKTEDGDHSYRPQNAAVPVTTFEGDNSVHIAQEYYYELGGKTTEASRTYYSECNRVDNTYALLSADRRTWHLKTATVRNNTELESFIRDNYGTGGCSLGAQTESPLQAGVWDVAIEGDGLEPPETTCWINYATAIKYYPAGNRVVAWDLGQDYSFWAVDSLTYTHEIENFEYDTEMRNSFRFIE